MEKPKNLLAQLQSVIMYKSALEHLCNYANYRRLMVRTVNWIKSSLREQQLMCPLKERGKLDIMFVDCISIILLPI